MHTPVLLKEIIDGLALKPGLVVVDATVGEGGHAQAIGNLIGSSGHLVGLDLDAQALDLARAKLHNFAGQLDLVQANFADLNKVLDQLGFKVVDRFLFDLGLRSSQLEASGRGFSFLRSEPLLMTFANRPKAGALTAYEIVNSWPLERLAEVIETYGEERQARAIAKAIVVVRRTKKIETSEELAQLVEKVVKFSGRLHPATKTFQALRIAVNDELNNLRLGLQAAWCQLKPGGRMAVVTFHGLEAKIVKDLFPKTRVIKPDREEILNNPRARSAQLRIILKHANDQKS